MTEDEFAELKHGDVVKSQVSGIMYIVTAADGEKAVGTRTAILTNHGAWDLVSKNGKMHGEVAFEIWPIIDVGLDQDQV